MKKARLAEAVLVKRAFRTSVEFHFYYYTRFGRSSRNRHSIVILKPPPTTHQPSRDLRK